ncbi:MAG TPA: GNAT family N-acetyltransferase, partial [bacterium]|nr:GNAT family N-acetyltransferase [bacterium]
MPILEGDGTAMNVRFERLATSAEHTAEDPAGLLRDLHLPSAPRGRAGERRSDAVAHRGETIAAVDATTGVVVAVVAVHPERDEGGTFFRLDALEVHPGHRGEGLEGGLVEQVEKHMRAHKCVRLKLGTSPLLTANAQLYVTRLGARYAWREGARTPQGQPWPYVSCECDFDDPLDRPLDLRDDEAAARSVLDW